jgi:hypothetical protein
MGEWRYIFTILDLGTRWRWVLSFTPRPLYTRGKNLRGTLWIRGWVDHRAGLDAVEERKILPLRNRTPVVPSVVCRYTDWAIPTPAVSIQTLITESLFEASTEKYKDVCYTVTVTDSQHRRENLHATQLYVVIWDAADSDVNIMDCILLCIR